MSMISELVERLRRYARFSKVNNPSWSEAMAQAADVIKELSAKLHASQMERSSQYYHGGWIPCEERMPEEKGDYLVTYHPCYWDDVSTEIKVGIDNFRGKTAWAKKKYQRIVAWRPLPEPYREARDAAADAPQGIIEECQAVDAEPVRHGHWIYIDDDIATDKPIFMCSECGELICMSQLKLPKYCPNCGAKIDGESEARE